MTQTTRLAILAILISGIFIPQNVLSVEDQDYPSYGLEDEMNFDIDSIETDEPIVRACITPSDIQDIVNDINVAKIFSEDIYLRTNPLNIRSLLDYPFDLNYYWPLDACDCKAFFLRPFYNQTRKAFFTKNSPFISSYINLSPTDAIEQISSLGFLSQADFGSILELFQNIKIEERRAGLMFGYGYKSDNIFFQIYAPLYYMEHNFFLTEEEREQIENNEFFSSVSSGNDEFAVEQFFIKNLVNDRWGIGDTRVILSSKIVERNWLDFWLGAQLTIPTAFDFQNGLIGSSFSRRCPPPFFDIETIADIVLCDNPNIAKAKQIVTDFLVGGLKALSANLVNVPLGNNGHIGLGPQIDFDIKFSPCISLFGRLVYEIFIPNYEERFFLVRKNQAQIAALDLTDPNKAADNLKFLSQLIVDTVYPQFQRVSVMPGGILKAQAALRFNTEKWLGFAGFDFYQQAKEVISNIPNCENLLIEPGRKSSCYQGKFFASMSRKFKGETANGSFGLFTDVTAFNKGIGRDWTAGINLGIEF